MYTGNNPSAVRSQQWLTQSLLELLEVKPYEKITIKEIAEKSDLARQTFYQLFETKREILEYHLDLQFERYLLEINKSGAVSFIDLATLYFRFFTDNSTFIHHLINNDLTSILNERFTSYLPRIPVDYYDANDEELDHEYAIEFISSGLVGVLVYWFRKKCNISIDKLVNTLMKLLN